MNNPSNHVYNGRDMAKYIVIVPAEKGKEVYRWGEHLASNHFQCQTLEFVIRKMHEGIAHSSCNATIRATVGYIGIIEQIVPQRFFLKFVQV